VEIEIGDSLDSGSGRESPEYEAEGKSDDWPWMSAIEGKPMAGVTWEVSLGNPAPETSN
jgi:hypothetical protein